MDKGKSSPGDLTLTLKSAHLGGNLGPEYLFIFVMQAKQQRTWRAGMEKHMVELAILGPSGGEGISDGMSFQSHQELQHEHCAA